MPDISTNVTAVAVSPNLSSYVVARDDTTIDVHATGGMIVPHGTEAQRTDHNFRLRGNTESDELEVRIEGEERIVYSGSATLNDQVTDIFSRLVAGDNITITRSSMTNSLTISGAAAGSGTMVDDARVRSLISTTIVAGDNITLTKTASSLTISGQAASGGASVSVSASPPNSPSNGDLWFDSDGTGGLALFYEPDDAWVGTSQAGIVGSLTDLSNVSGTALDGNVLTFGSATGLWTPAAPAGGKTRVQGTLASGRFDFGSLPAGLDEIEIVIQALTTGDSGSLGNDALMQIGDSGGLESTGYAYVLDTFSSGNSNNWALSKNQRITATGHFRLIRTNGNQWTISGQGYQPGQDQMYSLFGTKTLSGELDRIRIFWAGNWSISSGAATVIY